MKEIKSVRIRKKHADYGNLDIKVILYQDGNNISVSGLGSDGYILWTSLKYKKNGIYSDYSNDDFIKAFIDLKSKSDNSTYEIIQDPWTDKVPLWRSFGFDPYYLNDGSQIIINWTTDDGFVEGGRKYSDEEGNEIRKLNTNKKELTIIAKSDPMMHYTMDNEIDIKSKGVSKKWSGLISDKEILLEVIEKWNIKVSNELALCSPDNQSCSIIKYKSPLEVVKEEIEKPNIAEINKLPKIKIDVIIPTDILKVKSDISIKVYIGDKKDEDRSDDFIYNPYNEDISKYLESDFEGLSEEEFNIQDEVSSTQLDSDAYLEPPGDKADIKPVGSFDELLRLAGKCARELGKSSRVRYENLRTGYKKGIHGLCPQGTLAVLYALTGVKSLGSMRGHANSFSLSRNGTQGFPSSHMNTKTRVGESYFNDSGSWQIGDVIACDYIGKNYGHIQVWTGVKWVSDFTQNRLQVANIDWNSVALHRLNMAGVLAVRNQSSSIA